jgi:hypothetical protein
MGRDKRWIFLLPLLGIIVYASLYIFAGSLYPGGSQANKYSSGYNWIHNYWCNLLSENAINGKQNPARPVALTAMVILCLSLSLFWWLFFGVTEYSVKLKIFLRACAILSMLFAFFIFTNWHDRVINLAGLFGLVALGGTYYLLAKKKKWGLFTMGMIGLILILINNLLYHTGNFYRLPVVQVITFIFFLVWICCISIDSYRRFLNNPSEFTG